MRRTETKRRWFLCKLSLLLAAFLVALRFASAHFTHSFVTAQDANADLTGNWRVQTQNADGTFRRSYYPGSRKTPRGLQAFAYTFGYIKAHRRRRG